MACICRVMKCLFSLIMGSLRMLLFVAAVLLILFSIANTAMLFRLTDKFRGDSPDTIDSSALYIYALGIMTISTALLGSHGSFFQHRWSLKAFSILSATLALALSGFLIWANSSEYFRHQDDLLFANVSREQVNYDWDTIPVDGPKKFATQTWDALQNHQCCGIDGPHDWDSFRPSGKPWYVYPESCCSAKVIGIDDKVPPRGLKCIEQEVIHRGCRELLQEGRRPIVWYFASFSALLLVLSAIACCIRAQVTAYRDHERHVVAQVTIIPAQQEKPTSLYPNPQIYGAMY